MGRCVFIGKDYFKLVSSLDPIPYTWEPIYWFDRPYPHELAAESICSTITKPDGTLTYGDDMTLLIPDRHRPNQEDFIWALPIERVKWNKWYELAKKLKTASQGIRYLKRMENDKLQTILVMPNEAQTDDDAMTACAYLRMVEKVSCRMYVLRCKDDATLTGGRLIDAVMGIDPDTLHDVDEDAINKEIEEHGRPTTKA